MAEVRERLAAEPPGLVVARWLDRTPPPAWWGRADEGGGQVVEQATHLYDLAAILHLLVQRCLADHEAVLSLSFVPPILLTSATVLLRFRQCR